MTAQEKYLNTYKAYESLLRDSGTEPRQVEDALASTDALKSSRLRMCRLFRNYLSHEADPGFLVPTDRMQDFLESEMLALKYRTDVVKKHVKPAGNYIFEPDAKAGDVLAKILPAKTGVIASRVDGKWQLYSAYDVMAMYMSSKAARLKVIKSMRAKPAFAAPTDMFADLDTSRFTICADDGTPDGKVLGVVKFQ